MDFDKIISELASKRKKQNISQVDLASLSGISRATIQKIDQQTINEIGLSKVINLLDTLGFELQIIPKHRPPTLEELRDGSHA